MDFYEAVEQRHSVRSYKDTPVEKEKLDRILRAAQLAPTAVNYQAFKIYVISTKGRKDMLKKIYHREWLSQPPYALLICTDLASCWSRRDGKSFGDIDSAIVMDHIILAATAEGLGTCWVGAFDAEAAIEAFDLPDGMEPIAFTPLGYPDDGAFKKVRKDIDELVEYI